MRGKSAYERVSEKVSFSEVFRGFFRGHLFRKTQEGCGGLRGENPGAFPNFKAGLIFQQPSALPENVQTLAGIAACAAGKSVNNFPAASKFAGKTLPARNFGNPQPSRVF